MANLIRGKILVGYALWEFLSVSDPEGAVVWKRHLMQLTSGDGPLTPGHRYKGRSPLLAFPSQSQVQSQRHDSARCTGQPANGEKYRTSWRTSGTFGSIPVAHFLNTNVRRFLMYRLNTHERLWTSSARQKKSGRAL